MKASRPALAALVAGGLLLALPAASFSASQQGTGMRQDQTVNRPVDERAETTDNSPRGDARQEAEKTIASAIRLLGEFRSGSNQTLPASVVENAAAVAVIPDIVRAGLIAGGRYGSGVLLAHHQGEWSAPVFVSIGGGSLGAQIGVEKTDLILVFKNQEPLAKIIEGKDFTLGADAALAAGSSGARAEIGTETADTIAFQRTRGLFAGATVSGAVLRIDEDSLRAYYRGSEDPSAQGYYASEEQMARALLDARRFERDDQTLRNVPPSAEELRKTLKDYASSSK